MLSRDHYLSCLVSQKGLAYIFAQGDCHSSRGPFSLTYAMNAQMWGGGGAMNIFWGLICLKIRCTRFPVTQSSCRMHGGRASCGWSKMHEFSFSVASKATGGN